MSPAKNNLWSTVPPGKGDNGLENVRSEKVSTGVKSVQGHGEGQESKFQSRARGLENHRVTTCSLICRVKFGGLVNAEGSSISFSLPSSAPGFTSCASILTFSTAECCKTRQGVSPEHLQHACPAQCLGQKSPQGLRGIGVRVRGQEVYNRERDIIRR